MTPELEALRKTEADRLADLRVRARQLGFTVSSRGGYFHLNARAHDGSGRYMHIACGYYHDMLERQITAFAQVLAGVHRPSFNALEAAEETLQQQRLREMLAREEARPILNCAYCDMPADNDGAYRVGPEDIGPHDGYQWVHVRCNKPFKDRNQQRQEARQALRSQ